MRPNKITACAEINPGQEERGDALETRQSYPVGEIAKAVKSHPAKG